MAKRDRKPKATTVTSEPKPEPTPTTPAPEPVLHLVPDLPKPEPGSTRRRMPDERQGINRVFHIPHRQDNGVMAEFHMYITVNVYPDGAPGEIFIKVDKSGALLRGVCDLLGVSISLGLQHGVPLQAFTSKMIGTRFEPSGFTGDKEFPRCSSPFDLLARWLEARFLPKSSE
jgi:ribonucleoside-diphosphate reductase alpha chain